MGADDQLACALLWLVAALIAGQIVGVIFAIGMAIWDWLRD